MRILIHTDEYYPTAQACSYRMRTLTDAFLDAGNEVIVVASSANIGNGKIEHRREKILYSYAIKMKKKTTLMRMFNNISFAITSIFTARKAGKIDIVITTSPPPLISISGWIIAKTKKAKLIYDVRDIWPDVALEMGSFSKNSIYYKVFYKISRFMYKHADWITTVSPGKVEKIKKYVNETCGNIGVNKVKYLGNGFDENVDKMPIDLNLVSKYKLNEKFTCVYIGNIGLAQGLDVLLKVAGQTRYSNEVQFLLFGNGAEKERLERKVQDLNLRNVRFCGNLPHEKVNTILSESKISFISLRNANMTDSIPTKVYEAIGIGCPVLLVAEGDSCKIVEECGLGESISPKYTDKVVDVFDKMYEQYSKYEENMEKAKSIMHNKYSRQKIAIEFEKNLHQL